MSSGGPGILLAALLLAASLSTACTSPPHDINPPRGLVEEYVLAYNEGDADSIYAMLFLFESADIQPRYTDKEQVEKSIQESRFNRGLKIVEYFILDEYIVEDYAVITVRVIWEDQAGERIDETHDAGFLYLDGSWKMVNLILPGEGV